MLRSLPLHWQRHRPCSAPLLERLAPASNLSPRRYRFFYVAGLSVLAQLVRASTFFAVVVISRTCEYTREKACRLNCWSFFATRVGLVKLLSSFGRYSCFLRSDRLFLSLCVE